MAQHEEFAGPMPHPEIMAGYERVMPGAAERIFRMTEEQARHRQTLELAVVNGNVAAQGRGQWMGFTVAIFAVAGGFWLLHEGRSIEGYSTMFGSLGALAALFIWSRRQQGHERAQKERRVEQSSTAEVEE